MSEYFGIWRSESLALHNNAFVALERLAELPVSSAARAVTLQAVELLGLVSMILTTELDCLELELGTVQEDQTKAEKLRAALRTVESRLQIGAAQTRAAQDRTRYAAHIIEAARAELETL